MEYKYFLLEKQNNVLNVKFNRPDNFNALNSNVLKELEVLIDEIDMDDDIYVIIFSGEGKAFIAGADIEEMSKLNYEEAVEFARLGQGVFLKLEQLSKPTIAAINGYCLGGGNEFALSCDIRISSVKAKFGQPEVTLGITPGFAGTQRLAKIVGVSKAKEIIYTGKVFDANHAEKIGLVSYVYEAEELTEKAFELADNIAKNAQLAVRFSKKAINEGLNIKITKGNEIEANYFGLTFETEDQKNAMEAFLNKEKYIYKNK